MVYKTYLSIHKNNLDIWRKPLYSGLTACMNHQDCLGEHRVCSHEHMNLVGQCVCQEGYTQVDQDSVACAKRGEFYEACIEA